MSAQYLRVEPREPCTLVECSQVLDMEWQYHRAHVKILNKQHLYGALSYGALCLFQTVRELGVTDTMTDVIKYNKLWVTVDQTWIALEIKACRDAHILLSEEVGQNENAYEIVLGQDNDRTIIRDLTGGESITLASQNTENILHCDREKDFWFSWGHGLLAVGKGNKLYNGVVMFWQNDSYQHKDIKALSFASGEQNGGFFQLRHENGEFARD